MGYLRDAKQQALSPKQTGIIVTLRRNSDGREVDYLDKHTDYSDDHWEFVWFAHNPSCDCNRGSYFAQAAGEDDPDCTCSEHLYSVVKIATKDGRVLFEGDDRIENPYDGRIENAPAN